MKTVLVVVPIVVAIVPALPASFFQLVTLLFRLTAVLTVFPLGVLQLPFCLMDPFLALVVVVARLR